ncbi:hypothetical protein [Olivibacter sp. XZL3]|uniref:hypothetical protein n=1 Tax=Olivibacter sp. XZL3 TaxID=1735116 RepID=UPI001066F0DF|nr:hypothetical protein [Olivibacter sp. XZL3]
MENFHEAIQTVHFRYLKEDAIRNPFSFIKEFCTQETEVELFRDDILTLVNAASTEKTDSTEKFYASHENFVYDHKQIITVIEALWVLQHQPELDLSITETHPLYQKSIWRSLRIDVEARINGHAGHYRKLENQEINNIHLFLKDFFLYRDLDEWREILDDLLSYAHHHEHYIDTLSLSEFIVIREYLEKVAEAIFLIADLRFNYAEEQIEMQANKESDLASTQDTEADPSDQPRSMPSLMDANFTDGLIQYLNTFWSHLETDNLDYPCGPVMFTETLETELLTYFDSFHPKFLERNFRRVYMGYLEHLFETGTPYYLDELKSFTSHMDTFFELLNLADHETRHWPQENRIGYQEA